MGQISKIRPVAGENPVSNFVRERLYVGYGTAQTRRMVLLKHTAMPLTADSRRHGTAETRYPTLKLPKHGMAATHYDSHNNNQYTLSLKARRVKAHCCVPGTKVVFRSATAFRCQNFPSQYANTYIRTYYTPRHYSCLYVTYVQKNKENKQKDGFCPNKQEISVPMYVYSTHIYRTNTM